MNKGVYTLLSLSLFLFFIGSSHAQVEECIEFEGLENGDLYGIANGMAPGDLMFEEDEVSVYLQEFLYLNGNTGFFNVQVTNEILGDLFGEASGLFVFPSNINMLFDFSNYGATVTSVCFDFVDGGGQINLAVNGEAIVSVDNFSDAPEEIAAGVTLSVTQDNDINFPAGAVCLSGNIESLLVGGQEMAMDNVCFSTTPPADDCPLSGLEIDLTDCDGNGSFDLALDLDLDANINLGFDLFVNGDFFEFYTAADLPLSLEGLTIPNDDDPENDALVITVCENDNPDCCLSDTLYVSDCQTENCLGFEMMESDVYGTENGDEAGDIIYSENDVSIRLIPFQSLFWLTYFDNLFVLNADTDPELSTASGQHLSFDRINAAFDFTQYPGSVEEVTIDFYYNGGTVNLAANGAQILILPNLAAGFYNLAFNVDLEVTYSEDDPQVGVLTFSGDIYSLLLGGEDFRIDNLCINAGCSIGELTVEATPCDDAGNFFLILDFEYEHVSDNFALWLNGNEISLHAYEDLPLELGPFDGSTDEVLIYEVIDQDEDGCSASITLETIECAQPCSISGAEVFEISCANSGVYNALLALEHENTGETFTITSGSYTETFSYNDLPVQLDNVPIPDNGIGFLIICDNSVDDCCKEIEFDLPCQPGCEIWDLTAEQLACNDDGSFFVALNFLYENTSDFFTLKVNGEPYGEFSYNELPVTIGPFQENAQDILHFLAADASGNCAEDINLEPEPCTPNCYISDIIIEPYDCENGEFFVDLAFESGNTGPMGYLVFANGMISGPHSFDEPFITLGPFEGDGVTVYDFLILDLADPTCFGYAEFGPYDCDDNCHIFDVVAEAQPCTPNGVFFVDISFEFENVGNEGYKIIGNGNNYGTFSYNEPFPTLGPFQGDGETVYEFIVIDLAHPDCSDFAGLGPINCDGGECAIFELVVDPGDCNDNGTYPITINFEYENPGNDFFEVFNAENEHIGFFPLNELPVTIEHFEGSGNDHDLIKVCINDQPDCCKVKEFPAPDCGNNEDCHIYDVVAEAQPCTPNGVFFVDIHFEFDHVGNEGYKIVGNGNNYGSFSYNEPFPTLGPFEGDGETVYEFVVMDLAHPDCSDYDVVGPVDCENGIDCTFSGLDVETQCFPGEDVYELTFDFSFGIDLNVGFDVFTEGGFQGFIHLADLPVTVLAPLPGDATDVLTICLNDHPDCCMVIEYDIPCCVINDLIAEAHSCNDDGTFLVDIDFEHAGTSEHFVLSYGSENSDLETETFSYEDLPLTVGPFEGAPGDVILFGVEDAEFGCEASVTLESFYCNDTECAEFEDLEEDIYNPENGFMNGDTIATEDDIVLTYQTGTNDANCNCLVQVEDEDSYPDFTFASGSLLALFNGGIGFDVSDLDGTVVSFQVDYYYLGGTLSVSVNEHTPATAENPTQLPVSIAPGVALSVTPADDPSQGTMTFTGELESLVILGQELLIDNACLLLAPEPEYCIGLGEFASLAEPVQLAGPEDAGIVIHTENEVVIRARPLNDGSDFGLLNQVTVTPEQLCDFGFAAAGGPRWYLEGAIELDFSQFETRPSFVRFDYAYCPGTDGANLSVNGEPPFWGFFEEVNGELLEAVEVVVLESNNAGTEGTVMLFGDMERLLIGGLPIHIDNICFNGEPGEEDVWPGDANTNYESDHFDLLSIGLAFGTEGIARDQQGNSWTALPAQNWPEAFANGSNYKHADCNGDGLIDMADRLAIVQNYGLTHGTVVPPATLPGTDFDPPVFLDFPDQDETSAGTPFEVPIVLGTEEVSVQDIYGIAFTVVVDPEVFDLTGYGLSYPASWLGEQNINMITIERIYAEEGRIEIAMTRIDHNNVSGHGPIAYLRGIIDDIAGITETQISIEGVRAIRNDESLLPIGAPVQKIRITPAKKEIGKIDLQRNLRIFPNPTTGWVTIRNKYLLPVDEIRVVDSQGRQMMPVLRNTNQVSLEALPAGVYMFHVSIGEHLLHQKIVKME